MTPHEVIRPARKYNYIDDLWIISSFYNSNSYVTKSRNFETFIDKIERSKLNYVIVECAFGRQPFSLKKSPNVLRIRTPDIMWQKERLLNIALEQLPPRCKKVAWIDGDVLFENEDWAAETSAKLEHFKVIQPFKDVIRLPPDATAYHGTGRKYGGFAYVFENNPDGIHGHPGFAWASHKSILKKYGFYDVAMAGTGDHLMAHSFVGAWSTKCTDKVFGNNQPFMNHYLKWSKMIYPSIKSKVSYVDGTLLHLWHGDMENRQYETRERILAEQRFNPLADIKLNKNNCWEWNHNERLKKWAQEYFVLRKEDD